MELLSLSLTHIPLLAEIPDYGVDDALQILQNNSFISNKLGESFQSLWDSVIFDTNSSYWRAVVAGALDFALLGLILYAWQGMKSENDNRQKIITEGIAMTMILVILLGGNGAMASSILGITRSLDVGLTRTLAKTQVLDLSIASALKNISLSNTAQDRVNKLLDECNGIQGQEGIECLEKQVAEIEEIVRWAEENDPIANNPAAKYAKGILEYIKELANNTANGDGFKVAAGLSNTLFFGNPIIMGIVKLIFGGVQMAFSFGLEVASILHALLLPLVIGIIFTPIGAKYVETWVQGYVQLVSVKFLYIALIGLVAEAIVISDAQFFTGIPFLILSSVLGPMIAFLMAKGGGAHIAKVVASSTTSTLSNIVQTGATVATGGASGAGSMLGKSMFKAGSKGLARRTTSQSR